MSWQLLRPISIPEPGLLHISAGSCRAAAWLAESRHHHLRLLAESRPRLFQFQISGIFSSEKASGTFRRQAKARLQLRTEIPPQVGPGSEEWPADGVPVAGFPGRFLPYAAKAQSLMPDLQFMQPGCLLWLSCCLGKLGCMWPTIAWPLTVDRSRAPSS